MYYEYLRRVKKFNTIWIYMSLVVRKPVFGVSNQVWHKPGTAQKMARGLKFRILVVEGLYYLCSQNKACRSASRVPQSWSGFLFSHRYAKSWFSHNEGNITGCNLGWFQWSIFWYFWDYYFLLCCSYMWPSARCGGYVWPSLSVNSIWKSFLKYDWCPLNCKLYFHRHHLYFRKHFQIL